MESLPRVYQESPKRVRKENGQVYQMVQGMEGMVMEKKEGITKQISKKWKYRFPVYLISIEISHDSTGYRFPLGE